jgi:hypothetical protein
MVIVSYVSICVQLYCVGFHSFATCFGLHGHLHTYTQGNNKNNEGKQQEQKSNQKHAERDHMQKRQRNRILLTYENKYTTQLKMAM